MKQYVLAAALVAALVPALGHAADEVDIKSMTCEQLMEQDQDTITAMLFWLDGYLAGVTSDTSFNPENLGSFAEAMVAACGKSPDATLIDTAKIVGLE